MEVSREVCNTAPRGRRDQYEEDDESMAIREAVSRPFDDNVLEEEQLPRALQIEFRERVRGTQKTVILRCNGINFGDRLTDNIADLLVSVSRHLPLRARRPPRMVTRRPGAPENPSARAGRQSMRRRTEHAQASLRRRSPRSFSAARSS